MHPRGYTRRAPRTFTEFYLEIAQYKDIWVAGSLIANWSYPVCLAIVNHHQPADVTIFITSILSGILLSALLFGTYALRATQRNFAIVGLPWRKPWTWLFLMATLPWFIFWLAGAYRFATRPKWYR